MKKISFSNIKDMLSRDEMRQVKGGSGRAGTCGYLGNGVMICGASKYWATYWAGTYGGNWCCDSCASNGGGASYC
tara:strand:- start:5021 stop:5245 length:225 start_codon:yes stop_codon:yes gene_type:complete